MNAVLPPSDDSASVDTSFPSPRTFNKINIDSDSSSNSASNNNHQSNRESNTEVKANGKDDYDAYDTSDDRIFATEVKGLMSTVP
jgi:hypothetical protein